MAEEENGLTANELYFKPVENEQGLSLTLEETLRNNLVGLVSDRYNDAVSARDSDEERWLIAYQNYRGLYQKDVRFRESEKSRVFVKVTKTKVLAAFGQLVDVIFGANKFPIGISETKMPEGASSMSHVDSEALNPGIETSSSQMSDEEALSILGLQNGASSEQIKKAYYDLMKKFHPDKDGNNYLSNLITEAKNKLLNQ